MKRAVQLRAEEQQLHAGLPLHLRPLLKDKLLLWKDSAGASVPRLEDCRRSVSGFPLDGVGPVFRRLPDQGEATRLFQEQLVGMAKGLNVGSRGRPRIIGVVAGGPSRLG